MRIAILASAGGSAFKELYKIFNEINFVVVTDRKCDIELFCDENNIPYKRITSNSREEFAKKTIAFLNDIGEIRFILLYFLKLISPELFNIYPCLNIHPSLLPAFPGMNAVSKCFIKQPKFIGATLHFVDSGIDTGKIIGQVTTPILHSYKEDKFNKISFLQKVYLSILAIELVLEEKILFDYSNFNNSYIDELSFNSYANPAISDLSLLNSFKKLEQRENTLITYF